MRRLLFLLAVAGCLAADLRGVHPEEKPHYVEGADFECRDGSKKIPWSHVNDDFCDCADGTDEPGTAACANGHFFCQNMGFKTRILSSSFVDDGVCDCCDGSDEPAGRCVNTCRVEGDEIRKKLVAEAETHAQGLTEKAKLIERSNQIVAEKKAKLLEANAKIATHQVEVDALKEKISPIEAVVNVHLAGVEEAKKAREADYETRLSVAQNLERERQASQGIAEDAIDLSNVTVEKAAEPEIPKLPEEIELDTLKTQLSSAESALNSARTDASDLERFLNFDFGGRGGGDSLQNKDWASVDGLCVKDFVRGYNYEVCLFKSAKQGYTDLGKFDSWKDEGGGHLYAHGQRCWQGPVRQAHVQFVCGVEHEIISVAEPEVCKYDLQLASPLACSADHLNMLRMEVDSI